MNTLEISTSAVTPEQETLEAAIMAGELELRQHFGMYIFCRYKVISDNVVEVSASKDDDYKITRIKFKRNS